jgi:RNA polymerase sigma-70 factor, ECF subfamily
VSFLETTYSQALGRGLSCSSPFDQAGATDEQAWLAAARQGEPWALERFYHGYQPQVYALCYRLLGRAEDAEDAVQATFVRAFRALPRFRGDSAPRTWLYRIATNEALGLLRRRKPLPEWTEEIPGAPDGAGAVVERLAVRAALARLSPEHRAVLVLRLWEELSYGEIAAVLGISLSAVKMRLNRAREQFRRQYEDGA